MRPRAASRKALGLAVALGAALATACSGDAAGGDGAAGGGGTGGGGDAANDAGDGGAPQDLAPGDGTWQVLPEMPVGARQETGVASLNGLVYVVGGFDADRAVLTRVQAWDTVASRWIARAPLPKPLHHAGVAAAGGRIVVAGALVGDAFDATGEVFVYDPMANAWQARTPMPAGSERGAAGVAGLGGKVYVVGGLRGGKSVPDASVYDVVKDAWQSLPPRPASADQLVAVAAGGLVFAIGGRTDGVTNLLSRVDAFDPVAGNWSERPPMPTARGGAAAALVGGNIVVAGGEGNRKSGGGVFAEVEVFDPAANLWARLADMRTPRHGTGAGASGTLFIVPGGATAEGFAATAVVEAIDLDGP